MKERNIYYKKIDKNNRIYFAHLPQLSIHKTIPDQPDN